MNRKALFFDIDGTLFSESLRQVPQSAVLALKKTREKGNLVFINTGRTWCHNIGIRKEIETDGFCCGCGTYLIEGDTKNGTGVVRYDRRISGARAEEIKELIERYRLDAVLEGVEGCWMAPGGPRMPIMKLIEANARKGGFAGTGDWRHEACDFSKFCVSADENSDTAAFFAALHDFDIIDRGHGFYECVPAGHSKASIIEKVLKLHGIALEDAWVFGDSSNDLSMFQYVPNSVLMGVHDEGLEEYASFITKNVEEDGIAYAMEVLKMI